MSANLRLHIPAVAVLCGFASYAASSQRNDLQTAASIEQLARDGQTVQAEQLASTYLASHPMSVPVNTVSGELQAYRRNWQQAMTFFEAALRSDSTSEPAQRGERDAATALALHQRAVRDDEGALATLQHAHEVLPRDTSLLLAIAVQAQSMHRLKTAQAAADEALSIDPANDRARYALANILFERADFAASAQQYRAYLQHHPDDTTAHYGLGRVLRSQQRADEAKAEFERSIQLQPVQTEAYYQLGEISLEAGRDEEARVNFAKTLARLPTHGGALTGLGQLSYRAHDYAAARASLEQAVRSSPDYQPAHYYLGLTLRRLGETAESERELAAAVDLAAKQQGKAAPVGPQ